ncbi:hypothetical protein Q1695_013340 [Nippostrongylus brasiliensis]|nr:hypothetical protein Q1695_013340 [Nippostrongylus brasiliensis]
MSSSTKIWAPSPTRANHYRLQNMIDWKEQSIKNKMKISQENTKTGRGQDGVKTNQVSLMNPFNFATFIGEPRSMDHWKFNFTSHRGVRESDSDQP